MFIRRFAQTSRIAAVAVAIGLLASVHGAAATHNFLWKATSQKGAIYLLGSLHLLTADYYPLNQALNDAYNDSTVLVEEVDLGEMKDPGSQMQMLTRGMLPAGQSLETAVSPETYALITKRLETTGVPIEPLKRFKPWMLSIALEGLEWQKAGFDPSLGIDVHFYDRAKQEGKRIQGLETVDFQLAQFDEMPKDLQDRMLSESLGELDTEMANVTALAAAWKTGDAATVERLALTDMKKEPQIYDRLLVQRNRNWMPKIEALVSQTGKVFVVVGSAHLIGPDGLLEMLKAKGYAIEQL